MHATMVAFADCCDEHPCAASILSCGWTPSFMGEFVININDVSTQLLGLKTRWQTQQMALSLAVAVDTKDGDY